MEDNLGGFVLILFGLFGIVLGFGKFGKKDEKTKTGYKDSVKPQTAKGCALILAGTLCILGNMVRMLGI